MQNLGTNRAFSYTNVLKWDLKAQHNNLTKQMTLVGNVGEMFAKCEKFGKFC